MNKIFVGLLAVAAIALIVSQAVAGANGGAANNANNNAENGGVVIIESYTASAVTTPQANDGADNTMQPLPGSNGVEVAPVENPENQPVVIEEDMMIQQTQEDD